MNSPSPNSTATKRYVLVAEDDVFYSNIFKLKLTAAGYETVVVSDGQQLLTAAKKKLPDLILLDLIMPIMDGFETLQALKKDPNLKTVKVVIMSNLGQEEDVQKTMGLGAEDYLIKTNLSVQEMVAAVQKYLLN
ncbi:MAG TPA: response regulator [Vitreimonas sp.]|nr:response regulator [Vitreimonas sp.]